MMTMISPKARIDAEALDAAEIERFASLTEKAYRIIEEKIVTLALQPGAVVSEAGLSALLGIGRTPVREALQRLAREHLVTILPRRGVVVSEINVRTQLRLLELRREVERLMTRLAARRATLKEREEFRRVAADMLRAAQEDDDLGLMRLDRLFNTLLAASARNDFIEATMVSMNALSRRFWFAHHREIGDMPKVARLHADIALAVADGDVEKAVAASDALFDHVEAFTRATVEVG